MPKPTKAQLNEKEESRVELTALLNPNDVHAVDGQWYESNLERSRTAPITGRIGDHLPTIYIVIDTVSRSGMSRTMRVYVQATGDDGRPYLQWITGHVARVLGWRLVRGGRVRVDGCGMDMTFHLVDCLLHAVFGWGPEALNANHYRRETL